MNFGFQKKNTISIMTQSEYGVYILSLLTITEKSFFESLNIKRTLFSSALFYMYYLFICVCILKKKYSDEFIDDIINSSLESLFKSYLKDFDEDINELEDFKTYLLSYYNSLYTIDCNPINNPRDIKKIADSFLKDIEVELNAILNITLVTEISSFISFHFSDILNENILIVSEGAKNESK